MREKHHVATADEIQEGLLDAVSIQHEAESVADTLAESLANWFELPDREVDDLAEVLAHVGIGPDDLHDAIHTAVTRLAARAATKLVMQPPDREAMPAAAYSALVRLRVRARRRVGALKRQRQEAAS